MQNYDKVYVHAFFGKVEGFMLRGYIPSWYAGTDRKKSLNYFGEQAPSKIEPMYSSGVTAGSGCDFGQTTMDYLYEYGLDENAVAFGVYRDLASLFSPYIGKKKMAAVEALHKLPLTLTENEARALTDTVETGYITKFVIPGYNRDAVKTKFENLPSAAQACIASMCYQKGVGGVRRDFTNTWKALCRCDWQDAYNRLVNKSLWSDFKSRRSQEGELLKEVL